MAKSRSKQPEITPAPKAKQSSAKGLTTATRQNTSLTQSAIVPSIIEAAGSRAKRRFVEFFLAKIENDNTRAAYMEACDRFLHWCQMSDLTLETIEPIVVSAYFKNNCPETRPYKNHSKPNISNKASKKQHLAAVRRMFDELTHTGVIEFNPAASVRGPKLVIDKGLTPVMDEDQARQLLESIPTTKNDGSPLISGIRDRALIATMIYAFARVNATTQLNVDQLDDDGRCLMIRLHEKNGKVIDIPAHHKLAGYLDEYIEAAGIRDEKGTPLFRTIDRWRNLTENRMQRQEVGKVWKRRCKAAGLSSKLSPHSGRATGLTSYMKNDGDLEDAREMAGHATSRTTKMYVRVERRVQQQEVEKIKI